MVGNDDRRVLVPYWAVYLVAALVWPVWADLFVGISILADAVGRWGSLQLPAFAVGLSITLAAVLSYGLGTLVRSWAPPRLWIVPMVWFAIVAIGAILGFLLADVRVLEGLVGVLGPFLFASVGFAVGLLGAASSGRPSAP